MDSVKADKYLSLHYRYFMRETRIIIYSQYLESYKTVTLETMAREFGVSIDFIDKYDIGLYSERLRLPSTSND